MYLWATLSRLDPSWSWGWQWKSPGQHRRTTPSQTLFPNSGSALKATLQTQQRFGLEQLWCFLSLRRQRSGRLWRLCVFTTSTTVWRNFRSTGVNCLLEKAAVWSLHVLPVHAWVFLGLLRELISLNWPSVWVFSVFVLAWRPIQDVARLSHPDSWDGLQQTPVSKEWIKQVQTGGWVGGCVGGKLTRGFLNKWETRNYNI